MTGHYSGRSARKIRREGVLEGLKVMKQLGEGYLAGRSKMA
jgi:hypothetical protein